MTENSSSMGDVFNQRRAARQQEARTEPRSAVGGNRPTSFLDIQAEQESSRYQDRGSRLSRNSDTGFRAEQEGSQYQDRGSRSSRNSDTDFRGEQQGGRYQDRGYRTSRNSDTDYRAEQDGGRYQDRGARSSRNNDTDFRGNRGGDGGGGRRRADRTDLPLEQGTIVSIKDSFGFIHCADRPDELFFHFSEVKGSHPADLTIGDEVEFRVGPARNDEKMAAFSIKRLEPGTIVWEVEDEPGTRFQGILERPVRSEQRGSSQMIEGTIRLLVTPDDEGEEPAQESSVAATTAPGSLIRFTSADYAPTEETKAADSNSREYSRWDSSASKSSRGDNRLGKNDLVEFTMVTERRTGTKYARNITLLQSERERQRLAREKELLANATLEQGVVSSLKTDFGFLRSNRRRDEVYFHYSNIELAEDVDESEMVLKEGQEMEFLVVTEPGGNGRKDKFSAREIRFLPAGTVVFHSVLAEGVTGIVTRSPHPADSGHSNDLIGRVRLTVPIENDNHDDTGTAVDEIFFYASDAPGGSFSENREGSAIGLWVRVGDTLLFDVVKDIADGVCRVAPTKHTQPIVKGSSPVDAKVDEAVVNLESKKMVRLIATSLACRTEGIVHAIKDNYGFIHCAERAVDAYFRLYELFPDQIQEELRANMDFQFEGSGSESCQLKVGSAVQFDLSIQGPTVSSQPRSRSRPGNAAERENLKGQRILVLPHSTVTETKLLAAGVKGIVTKEDAKQPYCGVIELDEEQNAMSLEERHPLVFQLVSQLLDAGNRVPFPFTFPLLQSKKEDDVVKAMVDHLGNGSLVCNYVPVAGEPGHPGLLCISRTESLLLEPPVTPDEKSESLVSGSEESGFRENEGKTMPSPSPQSKARRTPQKIKPLKAFRYDKPCLCKELQEGIPPGVDDVVICDVVQSRRTGMVTLANVRVIERSVVESVDGTEGGTKVTGVGIVAEIVTARQFGFISLLDENASKREMLFFHLSSVTGSKSQDDPKQSSNSKRHRMENPVQKGDEVVFDIGIGSNGKRTAVNIQVVPHGTVTKEDKSACRGYILLEPAHTNHSNARHPPQKAPIVGGRWDNVSLGDPTTSKAGSKEEGRILLVDDPTKMFSANAPRAALDGDTRSSSVAGGALSKHLLYKNGAIVNQGAGASLLVDGANHPRRGDLVSFVKAKNGNGVRDVRVVTRGAAILVRGRLEDISTVTDGKEKSPGTAKFIAATDKKEVYEIDLVEVVSCDVSTLKVNEEVEGILYEGSIFGVCRTCDLYLKSQLGANHKERPRLNLTVRKELKNLGGKIMAQSMMAKGPDGSNGFLEGWTKRVSNYNGFIAHDVAKP